jgi:hypothetical protein
VIKSFAQSCETIRDIIGVSICMYNYCVCMSKYYGTQIAVAKFERVLYCFIIIIFIRLHILEYLYIILYLFVLYNHNNHRERRNHNLFLRINARYLLYIHIYMYLRACAFKFGSKTIGYDVN